MEDLSGKRSIFEIKLLEGDKLNFSAIYGNDQPVHLEIGSGRGEFLLTKAEQLPQVNFLALESKEKRVKTILRKLDPAIHSNVRICRFFVDEKVIKFLEPGSFDLIYIIHPDPWPKRKHFKNRLIQNTFLKILWLMLSPDGTVFISTDHPEYASWILDHFQASELFTSSYKEGFSREKPESHIETHFEIKKRAEGFPPYYMKFSKLKHAQE